MEADFTIKSMRSALNMTRQRCRNPNNRDYPHYGGRGITVCERWDNFETFLADMGIRPKGMTLDRVDNSKGYSPENCRWATRAEQSQNTRKTSFITYQGETRTVTDWAKISGISRDTLQARITILGYTPEQALTKPVKCGGILPTKTYKKRKSPDMTNCPRGENSYMSKLSSAQVLEIRHLYSTGLWTLQKLGDKFGVTFQTVSLIVNRKTYKDI